MQPALVCPSSRAKTGTKPGSRHLSPVRLSISKVRGDPRFQSLLRRMNLPM